MAAQFYNAVIAITGAGSGIGRALALQCAREGAKLALSDVDEAGLNETKKLCQALSNNVIVEVVNVEKRSQVTSWASHVNDHYGKINVIINNAGVNLSASVDAMSYKDFEWVMDIDFWGVVYGTKAFLPYMLEADWGHVVNVSSLFGLISMPNQSAYNAAKFAVRGFSESLSLEMQMTKQNVGVSCIHPGGVKTNIVNNARFLDQVGPQVDDEQRKKEFADKLARTTPEQAANIIINAIKKNQPRVLVGLDAKLIDFVQRILPAKYQKILVAALSREEKKQNIEPSKL